MTGPVLYLPTYHSIHSIHSISDPEWNSDRKLDLEGGGKGNRSTLWGRLWEGKRRKRTYHACIGLP